MSEPEWRVSSKGNRYRIRSIEDVGPDDPPEVSRNVVKITIEREGKTDKIVYVPKRPLLPRARGI